MTIEHEGGCLCGNLRYKVLAPPTRVTICHCRYCQRATGSAYLVEPIFEKSDFSILKGLPKTYSQVSEGSKKSVTTNFCDNCGTKLFIKLERLPQVVPVYGGTFDDPNWFDRTPTTSRHIFLDFAQKGTVIPAGFETYRGRAVENDGLAAEPKIYDQPFRIE